MTREDVRKILYGYQDAKRKISRIAMEIKEVESLKSSISIDYSKVRVMTSGRPDKVTGLIDRLSKLEERMETAREEAVLAMERVTRLIDLVSDETIRTVLTRRYLMGEAWQKVSYEMSMDLRWLLRLQAKGIDEIIRKGVWQ